jgi:plastocyanin
MNKRNSALLNLTTLALLALTALSPSRAHADGGAVDTMSLTDEPGNWFRSQITGTPVTVIRAGQRVDFKINNCCTSTRHTVTLLMKPTGSRVVLDQDSSQNGTLSATFDLPGVYLFHCKIHPYMTAVVGVTNVAGNIPDVTASMLPFIGHLGVNSLPASTVLSVITTIAPTDADKRAKWDILDSSAQVRPRVPGVGEVWVDTQFERVPNQRDQSGVLKPGTITVLDAATSPLNAKSMGCNQAGCGITRTTCGPTSLSTASTTATGSVSGSTRLTGPAESFLIASPWARHPHT